ncbi:META domain-containing protein [Geminisphaera colitermitum]|uniref:META domain-containing protein n=1 Tax=Geminisphaera colitermitum TaxID=1148786 RepID=UPI0002F5F3E9|nr:META domain-containing protein [Geminisphaera colitermitum]
MKTFLSFLSIAFASVLLLGGCASNNTTKHDPAPSSPAGHVWTLAAIGGESVVLPEGGRAPDLHFSPDGLSVSGYTGVNGFSGRSDFNGKNLKFGPLATTRRAGPEELMQIESRYTSALTNVSGWKIERRQLVLLIGEQPALVFELQPARVQL